MCLVAPSLLAADFIHLGEQLAVLEQSGIKRLHIDIMDGAFVPGLSFGPDFAANLRPYTGLYFDVHLMVRKPERFFEAFARAGADGITFHYEACFHWQQSLQNLLKIQKLGMRAGIALKPETAIECPEPDLLRAADVIQLMTVEPGVSGQSFLEGSCRRIAEMADRIESIGQLQQTGQIEPSDLSGHLKRIVQLERQTKENGARCKKPRPELAVDGGITAKHLKRVLQAGANVVIAGKGIFGPGPEAGVRDFNRLIKEWKEEKHAVHSRDRYWNQRSQNGAD